MGAKKVEHPLLSQIAGQSIPVVSVGEMFPRDNDAKICLGVCEGEPQEVIVPWMASTGVRHVVQTSHPEFEREVQSSIEMMKESANIFDDPVKVILRGVGREEIIAGKENTAYWERDFRSSKEKDSILAEVKIFVEASPKAATILDAVITSTDEMISNAIYNAPVDANNEHPFKDTNRSEKVELPGVTTAKIFMAHDGQWLVVGCVDPYGSLYPGQLLSHLARSYEAGADSVMNVDGPGGAHIGTRMMLDMCVGFYVAVEEGVRTLVALTFPFGKSHRQMGKMPKAVHVFSDQE
ncbi:MAG: hypothetical protein K2X47_16390 [Bdellovibrionales bacterium]|nr:hypothetical protein [Bdellovibrionales bacterium]